MGVPSKFNLIRFSSMLILLTLLFTLPLLSQTVIKEKITINPTSIHKNIQRTNSEWYFDIGNLSNGQTVAEITCFQPEGVDNYYRLTIEDSTEVQFCYGYWEQELLGGTLKVSGSLFRWGWYWGIILLTDHSRTDTQKVTVKIESIDRGNKNITYETKFYEIKILPDNYYLTRSTYDNKYTVAIGKKVTAEVMVSPGTNAPPLSIAPNELKLNLEVIKGANLGVIEIPDLNRSGGILKNVEHQAGKLQFNFTASGYMDLNIDTAIVRVSSDYPNIDDPKYKDFIFIVMRYEPIQVTFFPNTIEPGDTVDVILKKRNDDGTFSNFCEDQWFDIEIIDGKEYSTFYIPEWNYITDQELSVHQGFKLILTDPIPEGLNNPTILVMTPGLLVGSVIPSDINTTERNNKKMNYKSEREINNKKSGSNFPISRKSDFYNNNQISSTKLEEGDCVLWISDVQLFGTGTIGTTETERAYIKAYFEKSELMPGDTSEITIKMVDEDGNESDYPPGTLFEAGIKEGCELGNILTSSGITGKFFSSISSPIRFIVADSLGQDSIVVLRVGVSDTDLLQSLVNKSTQNINRTIIKESSNTTTGKDNLKYVMGDAYCAVGNYLYENKDFPSAVVENIKLKVTLTEAEIRPLKTGGNSITNAKIKVTSGGQPLANKKVKITVNRIERSGGHDHPNSPDLNLWGKISVQGNRGNPVTATTNQNGEINTDEILASEFGGEYYVEASLESNPSVKDKADLTVRVPDLQLLPASPYYDKIGGTDNHYGPPTRPDEDHNHWAQQNVNEYIEQTAMLWINNFPKEAKININDMSLPYGGKFDVNGKWKGAHAEHRTGNDIDIRTELVYYYHNVLNHRIGIPIRFPRTEPLNIPNNYPNEKLELNNNSILTYNRKFEEYCEQNSGKARIHSPNTINEHYHIDY